LGKNAFEAEDSWRSRALKQIAFEEERSWKNKVCHAFCRKSSWGSRFLGKPEEKCGKPEMEDSLLLRIVLE
jgi:hypothetical protein